MKKRLLLTLALGACSLSFAATTPKAPAGYHVVGKISGGGYVVMPKKAGQAVTTQPAHATQQVDSNFNPNAVNSVTKPTNNFNHFIVRVHLPSLLIGWLSGSVNYAFTRSTAAGFIYENFAYGSKDSSTDNADPNDFNAGASGSAFGIEMQYALSHDLSTDGWVVSPYAETLTVEVHSTTPTFSGGSTSSKESRTIKMIGTNLSYQWMWASGINMQFGFGVFYTSSKVLFGIANSKYHPDVNLTLGLAF